jgi:hypothetical protein
VHQAGFTYKDARSKKPKKCDIKPFRNHESRKGFPNGGRVSGIKCVPAEGTYFEED